MTDMLKLRLFALTGCALIVSFQAVQPRKQWVSVGWNSVYCAVNLFHIGLLLSERPRSLEEDERQLQKVLGDHVLHTQILSLSEAGQWQHFLPGTALIEEGHREDDAQVCIIVRGCCGLRIRGFKVGHLTPGAAVGAELPALRLLSRQEASETGSSGSSVARATVEVDSQSEVLCLCLPWSWLKSERPLLEALQKGFATSLAAQVAAGDAAARLLEYAAVLEMACYSQFEANVEARHAQFGRFPRRIWPLASRGPSIPALTGPLLEEALEQFRQRLGISEEEHRMVVKTLPQECHGSNLLTVFPSQSH